MVPPITTFGYTNYVPTVGFTWVEGASLQEFAGELPEWFQQLPHIPRLDHREAEALLVLSQPEREVDSDQEEMVAGEPLENGVLFREFGELDPDDRGSLLAFANEYGWLEHYGGRLIQRRVYVLPDSPLVGRGNFGTGEVRAPSVVGVCVEPWSAWAAAIRAMRLGVRVLDLLRAGRGRELKEVVEYVPGYEEETERGRSFVTPHWRIRLDWVRGCVSLPRQEAFHFCERFGWGDTIPPHDVVGAAWAWLTTAINSRLSYAVSPRLSRDKGGRILEDLVPHHLHGAMWGQMYQAVTGNKSYTKCAVCPKWYEVAKGAKTKRARFCSTACKSKYHRDKDKGGV